MEILDDANRFLYTSDAAKYAACERAIKQVTYTLERLSVVWKVRSALLPFLSMA